MVRCEYECECVCEWADSIAQKTICRFDVDAVQFSRKIISVMFIIKIVW